VDKPRSPLPPRTPHAERVLVVQTAFLGDIILTTPFLAALRALLPAAEICLLTTPVGASLLRENPWRIEVLAYDKRGRERGWRGFARKVRELRARRPGLIFCLHRSFRSGLLTKLVGGESWGFAEAAVPFFFRHRVSRGEALYESEKNLALLRAWAGEVPPGTLPFPRLSTDPAEEGAAASLLGAHGRFAVLAPSSVWATKRWPAERFGQLAAELWRTRELRTVLVGGGEPADREAGRGALAAYRAALPDGPEILDLTGKTSLARLKSVLSRAEIVIANDSAPLHLAIAVGTKVVGVFGPTTKELGFFPLAPEGESGVAEVAGLACRPCGLHGHHRCPEGHFRCMLDLSVASVLREVDRILCR
jgi:heptosyltransferase-2